MNTKEFEQNTHCSQLNIRNMDSCLIQSMEDLKTTHELLDEVNYK